MKIKRKHKIIIFIVVLVVFIMSSIIFSQYLLNGDTILRNFNIISITNDYTNYHIEFDKVKAAKYYQLSIVDENNVKVYDHKEESNKVDINLSNLEFNMNYEVMVYAYDKLGDYKACNETKTFKWEEPSITKDNKIIMDNKDYTLKIDGNLSKKTYEICIKENDNILKKEQLKDNSYKIDSSLYKDKKITLNIEILYKDKVISSINLYNKVNPIKKISITSPINLSLLNYNDISITYTGSENASTKLLKIYEDSNLIKETSISKNHVILSKKLFEPTKTYKIVIEASLNDYKRSGEVTFTINEKEQLHPVYISNNWRYIKKGSKIELFSNNSSNTRIYYTLDGSNPESMGLLYKEPIVVNKSMTLKAIAREDNKIDSTISIYDLNIGEKKNLTVYLSPSNQFANIGVEEVNYTNERDEMNDLANYIEERLKSKGVRVVRNNSSGDINLWIQESLYAGADLHLAIHSNASNAHDKYGIETWIDTEQSKTLSLANKIQKNLISIYPYKNLEGANRGVKYASGALGECNDTFIPFGILVEVAHHDYLKDAEWIMKNKKLIGYNIADSILEYYQII